MKSRACGQKIQAEWYLLGIILIAAILFFADLGKEGFSNSSYAAAVKKHAYEPVNNPVQLF